MTQKGEVDRKGRIRGTEDFGVEKYDLKERSRPGRKYET